MAQTLSHWMTRFTVNDDNDSFTIEPSGSGVTALSISQGTTYYIAGYTSEATNQLVEEFEAQIQTVDATATATYSFTTGKVTIANLAVNTEFVWTDTDLRDALGFTATLTGATTYTSTNECRYKWMPTRGIARYPFILTGSAANPITSGFWEPRSNTRIIRSIDGSTYSVQGSLIYDAFNLDYEMLPEADVKTPSSGTVYHDFQQFWVDTVHTGEKIRLYPDRTATTSIDYVDGLIGNSDNETVGSFGDFAERHIASFNNLWDITIPLMKFV